MKLIAYHLPQFHQIQENDIWWGEGFTEWDNVKQALPLFKGHNQPRVPLDSFYYDLSTKEAIAWQFSLAKKYGIYGFCFYHYWFEGKKVLEKPSEIIISDDSIDGNFCFCWANHSWRRTWNKTNELLIEQSYGGKSEWDAHLEYLVPFFSDRRYIKHEGKPVFVIYDISHVSDFEARFDYYDKWLKDKGFNGLYLIQSVNDRAQTLYQCSDSYVLREPAITHVSNSSIFKKIERKIKRNKKNNFFKNPLHYKFNDISKESLDYAEKLLQEGRNISLGLFREWDSTPRHGKHGYIISRAEDLEFSAYVKSVGNLLNRYPNASEYVFYNAWNEWGEGCYLEPDSKNGYTSLTILREAASGNIS
ncbi:glycoside hydrolase family 99-like domain-containing protein [Vibrio alginolyticus]|nr:glycoside hydrolase family 99-like domain-containing protein [Vibrio alginolyticus]